MQTNIHSNDISISSRIGNTKRKITLNSKYIFLTKDNDSVDKLFLKNKQKNILHTLESNLLMIILSLIFTIIFSFLFVKFALPKISEFIAQKVPYMISNKVSKETMNVLDEHLFIKSKMSSTEKNEIENSFNNRLLPILGKSEYYKYKIHFRLWKDGNKSIANAFALPNGDIIITDGLIDKSKNIDEINSIILHEVGHVEMRHSLERIIHNSFIAIILMYIVDDSSLIGDMGIGIGSLLIQSNYSQMHEHEADLFSFEKMLELKINPVNFINIMERITVKNSDDGTSIMNYFLSHPQTSSRINIANKYKKCFENNDLICK